MSTVQLARPTLLIVESNRALLDRLARHFSARGFAVTAVHHPRQAVASTQQRCYEQVLVGSTLPEVDGQRLAETLRRNLGNVRVVLLSDVADHALRDDALEAGIDFVPANPARLSQLEELLSPVASTGPQ